MSETISLRERRKIRRAARREAYDAVRNSRTLDEALAMGERRMRANYGSMGLTIALFIIGQIIKWLWENRSGEALPGLPPNWEAKFDSA